MYTINCLLRRNYQILHASVQGVFLCIIAGRFNINFACFVKLVVNFFCLNQYSLNAQHFITIVIFFRFE